MQKSNLIHRSPDLLDTAAAQIDTSFPVIQANTYELTVESITKEPNKKKTGENLVVKHKTTKPAVSVKGTKVPEGHGITNWISITPTDKRDIEMIGKDLATLLQAAGMGTTSPRKLLETPAILVGKRVKAKVAVSEETEAFDAGNNIKRYVVK